MQTSTNMGLRFAPEHLLPYDRMGVAAPNLAECDAGFKITTPGGVDELKASIQPFAETLDADVRACGDRLPAGERQAWSTFIGQWRAFAIKATPTFGSYGDWVQACTYGKALQGWRSRIDQACPPIEPAPAETTGSSAMKWLTVGAVVVGGVLLFRYAAPKIASLAK